MFQRQFLGLKLTVLISLISINALTATFTWAVGGNSSGGGNEAGIDFSTNAKIAIREFDRLGLTKVYGVTSEQLLNALNSAQILVDEKVEALIETQSGKKQPCDVTNTPTLKQVTVHKQRWNNIKEPRRRKTEALHEVLSLLEMEKTGDYRISSDYEVKLERLDFSLQLEVCKLIVKTTKSRHWDHLIGEVGLPITRAGKIVVWYSGPQFRENGDLCLGDTNACQRVASLNGSGGSRSDATVFVPCGSLGAVQWITKGPEGMMETIQVEGDFVGKTLYDDVVKKEIKLPQEPGDINRVQEPFFYQSVLTRDGKSAGIQWIQN